MNRRTKSDWQTLFTEHEQSGLTAASFCFERNLNPNYFSLRRKQLQTNQIDKTVSAFTQVVMTSSTTTAMMELCFNDAALLKIPLSVSPTWLVELIQQMQA